MPPRGSLRFLTHAPLTTIFVRLPFRIDLRSSGASPVGRLGAQGFFEVSETMLTSNLDNRSVSV